MYTTNDYCRELFGEKIYKISLSSGCTCPNRDGTLASSGCIFCSEGGSGDFAKDISSSIDEQLENAKAVVSNKYHGKRYIAYFQAYTNTYAPVSYLRSLYTSVIERNDIAALSIATRPDCLGSDVLTLLKELNDIKPVWIELGLQSIHKKSSDYIRRMYELPVYDKAVKVLSELGIHVITHLILGLPHETADDMLESVKYCISPNVNTKISHPFGIKLQLLHVLDRTDLARDYKNGKFDVLSLDEYASIVKQCVDIIPDDVVIHRLTGDGPKKLLIAPKWSANKKLVLNTINRVLRAPTR